MLTQTIEIQVNNPGLIPQINAIQADSGRTLDCIISDMAIPAGATARIYAQKPSGAKVFNNCAISDRTVSVDLTTQILAELGRTVCQVQITQGEEKVTSFDFIINVIKSRIDSTAIESTDEFTALENAIADAENALQEANDLLEDLANQPVAFTEAASNAYIASGDTVAELFGKIQKLFENVFELTPLKTIPSGADLNDYTDFGCWSVANATTAAAVENGPVTNSGYTLRVMRGTTGTNYIVQTVLTGLGVSYFRTLINTTWSDWEQAYSTKDIIPVANGGTGRAALAGSTGLLHDLFPIGKGTATYFMAMDAQWANPGYINIANMKTLLGMDNVFELNPTGVINANDDLNDYKEFGCWLCSGNTITVTLSNCPITGGGFTLRCMRGTGASVTQYVVQEIIDYYGRRYFRAFRNGTWDPWKVAYSNIDTIPIASGGTGATTAAAAIRNLAFLGLNPISSPSEDLPAAWTALGTGIAYIGASGKLTSQPGSYGFVLNFTYSNIVYQLWLSMNGDSAIYARSGNAVGWYSSSANWVRVTMSAVEAANYVTYDELATAIREGVNTYGA